MTDGALHEDDALALLRAEAAQASLKLVEAVKRKKEAVLGEIDALQTELDAIETRSGELRTKLAAAKHKADCLAKEEESIPLPQSADAYLRAKEAGSRPTVHSSLSKVAVPQSVKVGDRVAIGFQDPLRWYYFAVQKCSTAADAFTLKCIEDGEVLKNISADELFDPRACCGCPTCKKEMVIDVSGVGCREAFEVECPHEGCKALLLLDVAPPVLPDESDESEAIESNDSEGSEEEEVEETPSKKQKTEEFGVGDIVRVRRDSSRFAGRVGSVVSATAMSNRGWIGVRFGKDHGSFRKEEIEKTAAEVE